MLIWHKFVLVFSIHRLKSGEVHLIFGARLTMLIAFLFVL